MKNHFYHEIRLFFAVYKYECFRISHFIRLLIVYINAFSIYDSSAPAVRNDRTSAADPEVNGCP